MPRLLITVDTEISNFPRSMGLWGRVDGEDWGLGRLIDTFDEIEARGTFFLDAYAGNDDDLAEQRRAAELIVKRGHDLQLHTHPGPAFERARDQLRHYTLPEQEEIIELGCRRIQQWSGVRRCCIAQATGRRTTIPCSLCAATDFAPISRRAPGARVAVSPQTPSPETAGPASTACCVASVPATVTG